MNHDLTKLRDLLAKIYGTARENSAAIRDGQKLLEEIKPQLRPDVGGPYNTD